MVMQREILEIIERLEHLKASFDKQAFRPLPKNCNASLDEPLDCSNDKN